MPFSGCAYVLALSAVVVAGQVPLVAAQVPECHQLSVSRCLEFSERRCVLCGQFACASSLANCPSCSALTGQPTVSGKCSTFPDTAAPGRNCTACANDKENTCVSTNASAPFPLSLCPCASFTGNETSCSAAKDPASKVTGTSCVWCGDLHGTCSSGIAQCQQCTDMTGNGTATATWPSQCAKALQNTVQNTPNCVPCSDPKQTCATSSSACPLCANYKFTNVETQCAQSKSTLANSSCIFCGPKAGASACQDYYYNCPDCSTANGNASKCLETVDPNNAGKNCVPCGDEAKSCSSQGFGECPACTTNTGSTPSQCAAAFGLGQRCVACGDEAKTCSSSGYGQCPACTKNTGSTPTLCAAAFGPTGQKCVPCGDKDDHCSSQGYGECPVCGTNTGSLHCTSAFGPSGRNCVACGDTGSTCANKNSSCPACTTYSGQNIRSCESSLDPSSTTGQRCVPCGDEAKTCSSSGYGQCPACTKNTGSTPTLCAAATTSCVVFGLSHLFKKKPIIQPPEPVPESEPVIATKTFYDECTMVSVEDDDVQIIAESHVVSKSGDRLIFDMGKIQKIMDSAPATANEWRIAAMKNNRFFFYRVGATAAQTACNRVKALQSLALRQVKMQTMAAAGLAA